MTTTIEDLRRRAEAAKASFEEGRGRLIRPDGARLFSDEAHEEQMANLRRDRDAVLGPVIEEAREILRGTGAEIEALEHRDPAELLTAEELERANARRAFARDAAESLAPDGLVARCESVLAAGNRGAIFAAWMAGERRRAQILEVRRGNARRGADNPAEASLAEGRASTVTELDEILRRMRETLDGGRTAQEIEAVRERAVEASDVQSMAELARREQSSVYEPDYAIPGSGQYPYGG